MTSAGWQRVHLIPEAQWIEEPGQAERGGPAMTVLEVPGEPVLLQVRPGEPPRLLPAGRPVEKDALVLERIDSDRGARLLVLRVGHDEVRVNGQPAPLLAILGAGDQLRLDHRWSLRVAIPRPSRVGPARPEQAGRRCLICRTRVEAGDTIYACPCGAVMHLESSASGEPGAADALECARLSSCCQVCGRPVRPGGDADTAGEGGDAAGTGTETDHG